MPSKPVANQQAAARPRQLQITASLGMVENYLIVQGREWERYEIGRAHV